jgi:ABC-type transport system involved in multi-copper enzyme maturation permease subunit
MTATSTITMTTDRAPALQHAAPSMATLTRIELRKSVDTRAGRWLLIAIVTLAALVVVLTLFTGDDSRTFGGFLAGAQLPTALLLPVLGILSVTSEWSQRTALTTFTLVPDRKRVVAAKLAAATALGALAAFACVVVAAIGNVLALALDRGGRWDVDAALLGQALLLQVLNVLVGVAFGLLLLSSALAIVLFFVLPTAFTVVTMLVTSLSGPAGWVDLGVTMEPLFTGVMQGEQWLRLLTASTVWLVLPLAAGTVRLHRKEIS